MPDYQDDLPDLLNEIKRTAQIIGVKEVPRNGTVHAIATVHEITCSVEKFRQECLVFLESSPDAADAALVKKTKDKINRWMTRQNEILAQDSKDISRRENNPYSF